MWIPYPGPDETIAVLVLAYFAAMENPFQQNQQSIAQEPLHTDSASSSISARAVPVVPDPTIDQDSGT